MQQSVRQWCRRSIPPAGSIARPLVVAGMAFVAALGVGGFAALGFWLWWSIGGGAFGIIVVVGATILGWSVIALGVVVAGGLVIAFVRGLSPHRHWRTGPT